MDLLTYVLFPFWICIELLFSWSLAKLDTLNKAINAQFYPKKEYCSSTIHLTNASFSCNSSSKMAGQTSPNTSLSTVSSSQSSLHVIVAALVTSRSNASSYYKNKS